ncbi:hypothetical protein ACLI1A_07815 [Flavobacterium sp. RHBU_3]|uniref:hypothetical protein n=1 Tax=Flavobacterium sp. RHBU_3 TaxID=3391184 RepID=UPI0039854101
MKHYFLGMALPIIALTAACSPERENISQTDTQAKVSYHVVGDPIPKGMQVNKMFEKGRTDYSLAEMEQMYHEDIANAEPGYDEPLRNIWVRHIFGHLYFSGSDADKLTFVKHQADDAQPLLAEYDTVYMLLYQCSDFTAKDELITLADNIAKKNEKQIAALKLTDTERAGRYTRNLEIAKRNFTMLMSAENKI